MRLPAARPVSPLPNGLATSCAPAGPGMCLADCYEAMGRLEDAAQLLERVVEMDRKYQLPKLEENTKRLQCLRERLSATSGGAA